MRSQVPSHERPDGWDRLLLAAVVTVFIASRLVFHHLGVRFDVPPLDWIWQYIDPHLLRTRLLESTFYLHGQPPLFNLFMGGVLKLFPGHEAAAFAWSFRGFGIILAVSIYLLMRGFRVRAWLAFALSAAFVVSPASILYENWLFYTYPVAAMLSLAALLLQHYVRSRRSWSLVVFFILLAMVVLTRSTFHLAWFLACFLMVVVLRGHEWRRVVIAGLIPLAAVSFLYFKNLVVFDTFGESTWMGMSLAKMTTFRLPAAVREDLVRRGTLSDLALVKPFSQIDVYKSRVPVPEATGIPVLDDERKTGGHPRMNTNFNNLIFVRVSRQYLQDARTSLRLRPIVYLETVGLAAGIYFQPAENYKLLVANRARISDYYDVFIRVAYGQILPPETGWGNAETPRGVRRSGSAERSHSVESQESAERPRNVESQESVEGQTAVDVSDRHADLAASPFPHMGFLILLGFAAFLATGLRHLRVRGGDGERDPAMGLPLLFVYVTVIYLTVVACSVEIGENNRFRFMIDPLILTGVGLFINDLVTRVRVRPGDADESRVLSGGRG